MKQYDVIIKPLLTEKSYSDVANKKYAFIVRRDSNKAEIKKAVVTLTKDSKTIEFFDSLS